VKPRNLAREVKRLKLDWQHLKPRQRADIAASLWRPLTPEQLGQRYGWGGTEEAGPLEIDQLSELFAVSVRSIKRARARQQRAAGVAKRLGRWAGQFDKW
jgi:hypothetical protein